MKRSKGTENKSSKRRSMIARPIHETTLERRVVQAKNLQLHPDSSWKPRLAQTVRLELRCQKIPVQDHKQCIGYTVGLYPPLAQGPLGFFTAEVGHQRAQRVYREALRKLDAGCTISFSEPPGRSASIYKVRIRIYE